MPSGSDFSQDRVGLEAQILIDDRADHVGEPLGDQPGPRTDFHDAKPPADLARMPEDTLAEIVERPLQPPFSEQHRLGGELRVADQRLRRGRSDDDVGQPPSRARGVRVSPPAAGVFGSCRQRRTSAAYSGRTCSASQRPAAAAITALGPIGVSGLRSRHATGAATLIDLSGVSAHRTLKVRKRGRQWFVGDDAGGQCPS